MSDRSIIVDLENRDSKVIEEIIDTYGTLICGVLGKILLKNNCAEGIDECYNDTLLILWTKFEKFDFEKGTLRNWILSIAKYRALDYLRKINLERKKEVELSDINDESDLENSLINKEKYEAVKEKVMELPEKYRDVIYLKYIEGLSTKEISKALGISENLVYSREFRGKNKLKESMVESYE